MDQLQGRQLLLMFGKKQLAERYSIICKSNVDKCLQVKTSKTCLFFLKPDDNSKKSHYRPVSHNKTHYAEVIQKHK